MTPVLVNPFKNITCLLSHVLNGRDFAFVFTKIISNWSDMSVNLSLTGDYWLRFYNEIRIFSFVN